MTAFEKLYNVPTASLVVRIASRGYVRCVAEFVGLQFEDLHERLEACIRHPMFNSYEQSYIVPALRVSTSNLTIQICLYNSSNMLCLELEGNRDHRKRVCHRSTECSGNYCPQQRIMPCSAHH